MLFPPAHRAGPRTAVELATRGACPGLWPADAAATTSPAAAGANGPGLPLLGEHAHGRLTRPHLRGHRAPAAAGDLDDPLRVRRRSTSSTARLLHRAGRRGRRARRWSTSSSRCPAAVAARPRHPDQHRPGRLRPRRARGRAAGRRPPRRGARLHRPARARAHPAAAPGHRRPLAARGPRRPSRPRTPPPWSCSARPASPRRTARCSGVHVAWSGNTRAARRARRRHRDDARRWRAPAARARWCWRRARATRRRGSTSPPPTTGSTGSRPSGTRYQRSLPAHPAPPAGGAQRLGGGLLRPRPRPAAAASPTGRPGSAWSGSCSTTAGSTRRRDDTAGLGDWWSTRPCGRTGSTPLDRPRPRAGHGVRAVVRAGDGQPRLRPLPRAPRLDPRPPATGSPLLHRNQLVLDLTRPRGLRRTSSSGCTAILAAHPIDYVKWDHNRDLLEAGSGARAAARRPCTRRPRRFYALLDELRAAHPDVAWESCASGGGRIDLGVLERVQRVWTSDMTDALARQQIQRWTTQLVAPEYVGAHVSSPTSHTTGRTLGLDFRRRDRAVRRRSASSGTSPRPADDDLDRLADWVARYQRFRPLLHSGRVVRPESSDPAVLLHGVVAADRSRGAGRPRAAGRVGPQPRRLRAGARARPDGGVRLRWEGPVDHRLDEHVRAAAGRGPDGRHAGDRRGCSAAAASGCRAAGRRRSRSCT